MGTVNTYSYRVDWGSRQTINSFIKPAFLSTNVSISFNDLFETYMHYAYQRYTSDLSAQRMTNGWFLKFYQHHIKRFESQ